MSNIKASESIQATKFFEDDYVDQASYDNLRKISSCIDGLKNASRKVIYTILDKNIFDLVKVSQLASKAGEHADYLHGSLDGVVVTLAQDFQGTNQLPLLRKKGNFGTKQIPESSAPRYIFACGSPHLKELFPKVDSPLLISQFFEGEKIEPMYFVPDLPILLINGSRGISSGFAQNILPRNVKDLENIIKNYLLGKGSIDQVNELIPYFEDFNGTIERDVQAQEQGDYRWIFLTDFETSTYRRQTKVYIKDLPFGTKLRTYLNTLDKLEEQNIIKSWNDISDEDPKFEVILDPKYKDASLEEIANLLKLRTTLTENFTCIDENNKILEATHPSDILERYLEVKMRFLQKRKDLIISDLETNISKQESIIFFIKTVLEINDIKIDLRKMNSKDLNDFFEEHNLFKVANDSHSGFGYLHRIPMGKLANDELVSLESITESDYRKLEDIKRSSLFDIWFNL